MLIASSMVVDDFNVFRCTVTPHKTNTPLIVDPYRVLTPSLALQLFEPVSWGRAQIIELVRGV